MLKTPQRPQTVAPSGCGPFGAGAERDQRPLRQQVFERVRAEGRIARADITRALGVSPGSVTALTADMIAAGLLREVEGLARETSRGRPPVALEVVPESRYVIGIKISDHRHTAVLCDLGGTVLNETAIPAQGRSKSGQALTEETIALVSDLLVRAGLQFSDISSIGVGLPGIVDFDTGIVRWSPVVDATDVPLRALMAPHFPCPVTIDNDTNVLTLAELWFGDARDVADFAVVTIEQGVGMGLVLNNRLFRGGKGLGMELGHTKVQLDGALCRCGQRGCLEAYLADYALAREAATALDRPADAAFSAEGLLQTLFEQAKDGHAAALSIFQRAGRYLSIGLANVVQLFDPTLIILSGARMQYDFLYAQEVVTEMQALTLSGAVTPTPVEIHAWDDFVWARGAAALALSDLTDAIFSDGITL